MKAYQKFAVEFASDLLDSQYNKATSKLSHELQENMSEEILKKKLYGMFELYAKGKPKDVTFVDEGTSEDWPNKQLNDLGCVYIAITGDDFNEAINVTVSEIGDNFKISNIEWGRP